MENQKKTNAPADSIPDIRMKCWEFIKKLSSERADGSDAVAMSCGDRVYTYRQMFRRWERYAEAFSALGITEENGSVAGMTDIPAAESVFAFYALNMTGASVSMIHCSDLRDAEGWERMVREEGITDILLADTAVSYELLERILRNRLSLGIRRVIVMQTEPDPAYVSEEELLMSRFGKRRLRELSGVQFMDELLERYEGYPVRYGRSIDEAAYIAHTSGTVNGIHKPVPLSDSGLNEAAARMLRDARFAGLIGRSVSGIYMGLSSAYAMADMIHLPLAFGGRIILMPGVRQGEEMIRIISENRVNVMFTSGAVMDAVMRMEELPDFSSLEFVFLGGSYVSAYAKGRCDSFLEGCGAKIRVSVGYGLSEAAGAVLLAPPDCESDSMGVPLDGVRVKLRDESDGSFYDLNEGPGRGVLYISSPSVSRGMIGNKSFFGLETIDGEDYLNTYDLADVDSDGNLFYAGRMNKYFVNNEGVRFDAGLIETAVQSKPGIESCAMAPNYDKSIHDTIPVLYVSVSGSSSDREAQLTVTENALRAAFISEGLADRTNLPGQCMLVPRIPYNSSGKVDTREIVKGRVKGRLYRVVPVREKAKLSDVKLVPYKDAFMQRAGMPEELRRDGGEAQSNEALECI